MNTDELSNVLDGLDDSLLASRDTQLDEQEADNLLVEEGINEDHYPSINDIADENALDDVDDIN